MYRVLVWVPVPQVILQVDQDDHEAQAQLTNIYGKFVEITLAEGVLKQNFMASKE